MAGFPTDGTSYALLTTGYAGTAKEPNTSGSSGDNLGGGHVRGNSDYDVTILRIDLDVPNGSNCLLGMDFRFLSEEYPEYVGSAYNDAFVAEWDHSTWTTSGSTISAPDNFAFDPDGNPISINSTGVLGMTPDEALGTTYDGATPILTAATPVSAGRHSLYLSIFDQGDAILDSAVMVDRLRFGHVGDVARDCKPGAEPTDDHAQVLVVHGVTQNANDPIFQSLRDKVSAEVPNVDWTQFRYYQDKSGDLGNGQCDEFDDTQQPPAIPPNTLGLPYDDSQNFPRRCDSQGDVGQNVWRLEATIKSMYERSGKPVILVGYSMGGLTIRTFLAYSMSAGDGVAQNMVDSVITLHGVEQGSALAGAGQEARKIPFGIGAQLAKLAAKALPDPRRPANEEFVPTGPFIRWMHQHSAVFPDIPFYNTWGDERLRLHHCFLLGLKCLDHDFHLGDIVLFPGTDNPTEDVKTGGHRFLPKGYTASSWQWSEPFWVTWDPVGDPLGARNALGDLWTAPHQHSNYPNHQSEVTVIDCKTGDPVTADTEIAHVIVARLQGSVYTCDPSLAP